jgi:glycerol-1-phosphate dehydrogenase [NAD(P)+]
MTDTGLAATDLDAIRARLGHGAALGVTRKPIGLRAIHIGPDALDELAGAVADVLDPGAVGDIVVLTDATPMRRGPADVKADAVERLRRAHGPDRVRHVLIGPDRAELHVDPAALAEADAAIAGAAVVVSVGSGTVTDIAKDAAHRADLPFVVVQTAVSVNAFSDDMAVLLRDGVKRTVPSRWPDALVIDLRVVADAPPALNRAGFGELTAMFTAPADWYLASAVAGDGAFDPGVVALYRERGDRLLAVADGVARGDLPALEELAAQMTLTGIAMGVAGRTAPLSGTEHTISHLLDMAADLDARGTALHGAQVGVAAVVVALAWRRVLRDLDPDRMAAAAAAGEGVDLAARHARVAAAFDRLDADGAATAECWADYRRKAERWDAAADRRAELARDWDAHRALLGELVLDPERIVAGLRAAGAPTRFSELEPAIPADLARWAVASCHLMRDRFTVADLVDLSGAAGRGWDAAFADDLLAEAAELGAGL